MTKIKLDLDRLAANVVKDNVFGRRYDSYLVVANNINYDFQGRLDLIMPNGKLEIDKNTDELVYILTTSGVIPPKFVTFRYDLKEKTKTVVIIHDHIIFLQNCWN